MEHVYDNAEVNKNIRVNTETEMFWEVQENVDRRLYQRFAEESETALEINDMRTDHYGSGGQ